MESQMYSNPLYQENQVKLKRMGYRFLEPDAGHLASGRQGIGRFPPEEEILRAIEQIFLYSSLLSGFKVLVTAGPTREMIDPMRCITNKSSGKMGFALAEEAHTMGAEDVLLISGPTQIAAPTGINFVKVESAEEMKKCVLERAGRYDFVIMAAAVADWRPKKVAAQKIKKLNSGRLIIELEKTPDILKELGRRKTKSQILVGFAAESENLLLNAKKKLQDKNLDLVLANSLNQRGSGPESHCNQITLLHKNGTKEALPLMEKRDAAIELWRRIVHLKKKSHSKTS
jgi:phosphopantothenoylcysteine decarboxylase/phosphopantothenate--cysteine ligase